MQYHYPLGPPVRHNVHCPGLWNKMLFSKFAKKSLHIMYVSFDRAIHATLCYLSNKVQFERTRDF